ncbi:MAG: hypothetical protein ACHQAQ_02760 [Hyphomicrobiales bacterium]
MRISLEQGSSQLRGILDRRERVGVVLGFHIVDGDALVDLYTGSDPMPAEVKNRQNLDAQAISKARSNDWQQSVAFSNCVQRQFQIEMNELSINILIIS